MINTSQEIGPAVGLAALAAVAARTSQPTGTADALVDGYSVGLVATAAVAALAVLAAFRVPRDLGQAAAQAGMSPPAEECVATR